MELTETLGGYKTDYKYILSYYKKVIHDYDLKLLSIAYDPHNADVFLSDLDEFGCDLTMMLQSARNLNDPTDDFRNADDAHKMLHSRSATMLTCAFSTPV
jgi:phage terminase large subunit-like protein